MVADQSSDDTSPDRPHSAADDALAVETVVTEEHRRWVVEIVVVFADGVVRQRISTHPTRRLAELSADLIRRTAERNIRGPLNGSS